LFTTQLPQKTLSMRELEVLELVARGRKNREIALLLEIEERTVRFHMENILDKLQVNNRAEAACHALKKGGSKIDLLPSLGFDTIESVTKTGV
jgi:DNA-binding NarL/FixJ family response regulator